MTPKCLEVGCGIKVRIRRDHHQFSGCVTQEGTWDSSDGLVEIDKIVDIGPHTGVDVRALVVHLNEFVVLGLFLRVLREKLIPLGPEGVEIDVKKWLVELDDVVLVVVGVRVVVWFEVPACVIAIVVAQDVLDELFPLVGESPEHPELLCHECSACCSTELAWDRGLIGLLFLPAVVLKVLARLARLVLFASCIGTSLPLWHRELN